MAAGSAALSRCKTPPCTSLVAYFFTQLQGIAALAKHMLKHTTDPQFSSFPLQRV